MFKDKELWNFDITIAKFMLPRLVRYKKISKGYPGCMTERRWNVIIDEMIDGFDCYSKDKYTNPLSDSKMRRSMYLLSKYYNFLWD